ncbi:MAG: malto-oligosyltrehalose synthase, partial [Pseudomonas sp.]
IRRALQELIVHFPVYRTYISPLGRSAEDEVFFQKALGGARQTLSEADWPVLDCLANWLGGMPWRERPRGSQRKRLRHACVRFQQLTSPAAAKAVEDTALYRSAVLLSRNDVGYNTERFSAPVQEFHDACIERLKHFPDNLITTATHDHKRGEDTRARLAVVSERPDWYTTCVEQWRILSPSLHSDPAAPSAGDELILYQALLGSWPLDLDLQDQKALGDYAERLWQWQRKALREAKLQSSWAAVNDAYEQATQMFLERLLLCDEGLPLRCAIAEAVQAIAPAGALNSLAQTLLRMTVPGVPDLYQGNEFWDFSLVDPDNRRPVDFPARREAMQADSSPVALLRDWRDGRIKQALIARALALRSEYSQLFRQGSYQPLSALGEHAGRVLAFMREHKQQRAIVVVPIHTASLLENSALPQVTASDWGDTRVSLPFAAEDEKLKGLFASATVTPQRELMVSAALGDFPVNVFIQS